MGKRKYITMGIIFVMVGIGFGQIPPLINYQGMLTDASGNPINGTVSVVFRIYDMATGGTALWEETQGVSVLNGLFNVLLGSVNPIPLDLFSGSERYLGLTVGSDAEMVPRKRLVSVGYSFRAEDADHFGGKEVSDFVQAGQANSITTGTIRDNAVTADKILPNIVSSVNGVVNDGGNIDLVAGSNITIVPNDGANTITISALGGGGGDITAVIAGDGLIGGGTSGDVTLHAQAGTGIIVEPDEIRLDASYTDALYVNEGQGNSIATGMITNNTIQGEDINTSTTINAGKLQGGGTTVASCGVFGSSSEYGVVGSGYIGVFGSSSDTGVFGIGSNYAGYFEGNVHVTRTLSKGSGSFKIDHPLDPQSKYLQHSFVNLRT